MINVAAIRMQQFGVQFYQASLTANDIDKLVRFEVLRYGEQGTSISQQSDKSYIVTDPRFTGTNGTPTTFTIPFPDFNVRSILSNMVVRWEYRPGSTLFFVWQQSRDGFEPNGELVRLGDLFGGFKSVGSNFFAIKANFWIPAL